jgi:hypothetical protein
MRKKKIKYYVPAELTINGRLYKSYHQAVGEGASFLSEALQHVAKPKIGVDDETIGRESPVYKASPPVIGESLILLLCPTNRADAILGDLAEQFESEAQKKGIRRATLLYWVRSIRSFGPLLISKLRNTGIWLFVIEIGRRWIGS